ncbi:MAG: inositol monophosphatase [Oscillospiraceae bacterium]|nr:inositol monophosphatase [Oscillospiraceae bacterium]
MLKKITYIAREAGEMIRCAHDIDQDIIQKTNPADVVTKYDTAVQAYLRRELLTLMPEAGFLGEEGDHEALTQEWVFIVDPIDGTTNFVRNMGHSNISIALAKNGIAQYGVVYNPFRDELFAAQLGGGAMLNGNPVRVSENDATHAILLSGSTAYDRELTDRHFAIMRALYDRCADYRRFGAAALDLCDLACGRAEVFFECRLRPWDIAAGSLILTEAGGIITQLDGSPVNVLENCSIFATNSACSGLLDVIRGL